MLKVSGYAASTNKIGLAISKMARTVFLCIIVKPKKFNKYAIELTDIFGNFKKIQRLIFALTSEATYL